MILFFLGEDGPTHQPIEVLPLLRSTPNLLCVRPADGNEVFGAYVIGINYKNGPTVICLSRQNVDSLQYSNMHYTTKLGAYIVYDTEKKLISQEDMKQQQQQQDDEEKNNNQYQYDAILISTGSEVGPTIRAAKILHDQHKYKIRVVSAPCLQIFQKQPLDYIKSTLIPNVPVISVEAASSCSWENFAHFHIGVDRFGASANLKDIAEYFGYTPEKIADATLKFSQKWANNKQQAPLLPIFWKLDK